MFSDVGSTRSGGKKLFLAAVALSVVLPLSSAQGQVRIGRGLALQPQVDQDNPAAGRDPNEGVFVHDSTLAQDKLTQAMRMEQGKDWSKAADLYQEVLEKYSDRVIPSRKDDKNRIMQYRSVAEDVKERLCRWPQEGLDIYKQRYEPAAASILERSRRDDYAALHSVMSKYFVTDAAKIAALRLMDLYMEDGEFTAAAWIGRQLLNIHPNLTVERPRVLFKTAVALHLSGDAEGAGQCVDELKSKFPAELGKVAGQDVVLADAANTAMQETTAVVVASGGGGSWPMVGGNPARNLVPAEAAIVGARVYGTALPGLLGKVGTDEASRSAKAMYDQFERSGMASGMLPVTDRGQLFFQDGMRVWALQLESGVPLSGWVQSYGTQGGVYRLSKAPSVAAMAVAVQQIQPGMPGIFGGGKSNAIALTDTSVYAIMGISDTVARYTGRVTPDSGTRLVCLDRETGREKWIATPKDGAQDPANVRNLSFSGSPLVVGDNAYVMARGSKLQGQGGEECNVFCFDSTTGKFRWSTYVAESAGNMNMYMGGMNALDQDLPSHLAYSSGRVFCLTNTGAVAAIDAFTGAIAWLDIYARNSDVNNMALMNGMVMPQSASAGAKPWQFNPVIVSEGKLFVLPADGKAMSVYDIGTGQEVKRVTLSKIGGAVMLLGVAGDMAMLASDTKVLAVPWAQWDDATGPAGLKKGSGYWQTVDMTIAGRPFMTRQRIYVPTRGGLELVDAARGRIVSHFPRSATAWPDGEGPGNVVVSDDHVIIAGAKSVNVYTDVSSVEAKYLASLKADPGNVEPRLVYCELMFNAGELDKSRKTLDEAIDQLGGLKSMRSGAMRDRVFSDAVTFAQKLGKDVRDAASVAVVDELFDRAAAAAESPSQNVNYRFARARFIASLASKKIESAQADFPRAVELYQEVLASPAMRPVVAGNEETGAAQASVIAERSIAQLIREHTPEVYAKFEQEAAQMLATVRDQKDPDKMLAVAVQYPNSHVATDAMTLAAESYESVGKPRLASQVLRRLYLEHSSQLSPAEKARLNGAMARNYLKIGNRDAAIARLQIAASIANDPLPTPLLMADGSELKTALGQKPTDYQSAASALSSLRRQSTDALMPDMHLARSNVSLQLASPIVVTSLRVRYPFNRAMEVVVPGVKSIARTPREIPDGARHDRIVAFIDGKNAAFAPGSDQQLWSTDALAVPAAGVAWTGNTALLWGGSEMAAIADPTGKTLWKIDLKSLQPVDLVTSNPADAPAETPPPVADGPNGDIQRIQMLQQQRMIMMRGVVINGVVAGAAQPGAANAGGPEAIQRVRVLSDRLVVSTTTGRVFCVSRDDGKALWQARLASRAIEQLVATDDFTAARIVDEGSVQLVVLDTFNGQQVGGRSSYDINQGNYPLNIALAPDGTLVWTTMGSMNARDLYEPANSKSQRTWTMQTGSSYNAMTRSDQLTIWQDQVLAVCNEGQNVDRRSLKGGLPYGGKDARLQTQARDVNTRLYVVGSSAYAVGSRGVSWWNLDNRENETPRHWDAKAPPTETMLSAEAVIDPSYVVVPCTVAGGDAGKRFAVVAFSIAGGKLEYDASHGSFVEATGIALWQPIHTGLAYVSTDEKLHMLRGARP